MVVRDDSEPVELNVSPATVSYIINAARRFDEEPGIAGPDGDPEDATLDDEDGGRAFIGNPAAAELREAIEDRNDDEVVDLIAITWVGRGDFGREEWQDARAMARERHRRQSADYLMGMPTLGDYLEEGLTTLGHAYEAP